MMAYATCDDVEKGFRKLDADEKERAEELLIEAAVMIDANAGASALEAAKKLVSCFMVRRVLGDGQMQQIPVGAAQGTISALGYSQSWSYGSGTSGELYLSRKDMKLLGINGRIGSRSPLEDMT